MSNPLLNRKRNIQVHNLPDGRKMFSYTAEFLPMHRYFSIMDAKHDFGEGRSVLKPYVNKYLLTSRGFNTNTIIEKRDTQKTTRKSLSMTANTLHSVFDQNNIFSHKDSSIPHYDLYINDTHLGSIQYYNCRTYRITKEMSVDKLEEIRNNINNSYGSIIRLEAPNQDWSTERLLNFMRNLFISNRVDRTLPIYAIYDASIMSKNKFYGQVLKTERSTTHPFKSYLSDVIDSASTTNEFMENQELMGNSNEEIRLFSYRIPLISNADGSSFNIVYHRYPNKREKNHGFEFHFQYVSIDGKVVNDENILNVILIDKTPGVADISNYLDKHVISKQNFFTRMRRLFTILKRRVLRVKNKNYDMFFQHYLSIFKKFVKHLRKMGLIPRELYNNDDYIISSLMSYKTTGDQTRLFDNYAIENTRMGGNIGHIYTLSLDGYLRDLNYLGNMVSFVNDGRRTLKDVGSYNKLEFFLPFVEGIDLKKDELYERREPAKLEKEKEQLLTLWKTYYQNVDGSLKRMYAHYSGMSIHVSKKVKSKYILFHKLIKKTKSRSLRVELGDGSRLEMVHERHLYYMMLLDIYHIFSLLKALENKEHYRYVFENMKEYDVNYIKNIRSTFENETITINMYEKFVNMILREKNFIFTDEDVTSYNSTLEGDISLLNRSKNMSDDYVNLELYNYVESMKSDYLFSLEGTNEDILTNETMVSILEDVIYKPMFVDEECVKIMNLVLVHYYEMYIGENESSVMTGGGGHRVWNIERHRKYTVERMREYGRKMMEIQKELSNAIHLGALSLEPLDNVDRENLKKVFPMGWGVEEEQADGDQHGGIRRLGMDRQLRTGRETFMKDRREAFGRRVREKRKERILDQRLMSVLVVDKEILMEHLGSIYGLFEFYLERICNLVVYSVERNVLHREYIIHRLDDSSVLDSFKLHKEDVDILLEEGEKHTMDTLDTQMIVSTRKWGVPYQFKIPEGMIVKREKGVELPNNYTTLEGIQYPSDLFVHMMLSLDEKVPMAGGSGGGQGRITRNKNRKYKTRRKRRGRRSLVSVRNTRRRVNS